MIGIVTPVHFLSNPISFLIELNENIDRLQDNAQFLNLTTTMLAEYAGVHVSVGDEAADIGGDVAVAEVELGQGLILIGLLDARVGGLDFSPRLTRGL